MWSSNRCGRWSRRYHCKKLRVSKAAVRDLTRKSGLNKPAAEHQYEHDRKLGPQIHSALRNDSHRQGRYRYVDQNVCAGLKIRYEPAIQLAKHTGSVEHHGWELHWVATPEQNHDNAGTGDESGAGDDAVREDPMLLGLKKAEKGKTKGELDQERGERVQQCGSHVHL